ncbi:EAL domain-containing protein [Stenotrophomonas maltophilia]|uniref:EAL domain-containing protein n=1 Tax=Stenotrophomonas maltophilia TaxID=40324 RepID=UPI001559B8B6|nr:EAL domain-containing protein [Stenotrophomonas maltophilia]
MNGYDTNFGRRTADVARLKVKGDKASLPVRDLPLHYQPKIALASGRITGVEVFACEKDLSPAQQRPSFSVSQVELPTSTIGSGCRMLQQACAQLRSWRLRGLRIPGISINLTPMELHSRGFTDEVEAVLRGLGLAPHMLTLEIAEELAMEDSHRALQLHELAELGVRISLDDFGTGFVSLRHLRQLPIEEVKIDRRFIADMGASAQSADIVAALIAIARACRIISVATGVETIAQQAQLAELGCDEIQGSVISPGLVPDELERVAWSLTEQADRMDTAWEISRDMITRKSRFQSNIETE